jgi:uncharacterized membrane protein YbhN (UPF0104 family)
MSVEPSNSPPAASPSGAHRHKGWVMTVLKIAIAVVGIWWVAHHTSWNDSAIVPEGKTIRNVVVAHDTEVRVLAQADLPATRNGLPAAAPRHTLSVEFPTKIDVTVDGQPQTMLLDQQSVIPRVVELSPDFFKSDNGEIVHQGIHGLLVDASGRWYLLVLAWLLLIVPFIVTAVRWRGLLRPQGIEMPLSRCLQLTFVGQFYSILLPGVTGGDLVKIVYTARLTGSYTKSLITILLDRVLGLVALMTIAAVSAGVQLGLNAHAGLPLDSTLLNVFMLIVALMVCLGVGALVYFSHRLRKLVGIDWFIETFGSTTDPEATHHQHDKLEALFRVVNLLVIFAGSLGLVASAFLLTRPFGKAHAVPLIVFIVLLGVMEMAAGLGLILHTRIVDRMMPLLIRGVGTVIRVDEVLHTYHGHFGLLVWAYLISLPSQLTLPLSAWLSGLAFGMTSNIGYYLAYVPVAVLAASLPISPPQGFGIMDFILFRFFVQRGTASAGQAIALAQSIRFLPIIWNLFGGYWVVTGSYSRHEPAEAAGTPEKIGTASTG